MGASVFDQRIGTSVQASLPHPPSDLLRAELVRALYVEGAHFRANVLFAVSDPDLLARADSLERLDHLRQGLSELTDLASCRYVTGCVPPVTLVCSSLRIIEAVAPVESVEVVIDISPVEPLVGDETDTALLLVLALLLDARRRVRETGKVGKVRVGIGESEGGIDFTFDLDGRESETGLARAYALAAPLAAAYGATMVERGAMLMPVLCLPASTTARGLPVSTTAGG